MLPASFGQHGTIQQYYREVADPSYRPRIIQYPVKAQITRDNLEISTDRAELKIDAAACYRDMDLYINPLEFGDYISGLYQQAYVANLDALVSEGRYLAAIESGNSVPQLIVTQTDTSFPSASIKPKSPPAITYQPARVNFNYTPGDVTMVPAQQGVGLNVLV